MDTNEPGREPTEPTDAEHRAVLDRLIECYAAWEPLSCVLGDVRSRDAIAALSWALSSARPMPDTPAPDEVAQLRAEVDALKLIEKEYDQQITKTRVTLDAAGCPDLETNESTGSAGRVIPMDRRVAALLEECAIAKADNTALTARVAELEAERITLAEAVIEIMDGVAACSPDEAGKVKWREMRPVFAKLAAPGKEPTSE